MSVLQLDERGIIIACAQCGQHNRLAYERITQAPRCAKCRAPLPLPAEPVAISAEAEFAALTARAAVPVLVDFWADWCGPCKMVAPEVAKVATAGAGRWLVAKLNTEELPAVAQRFRVTSIPLFVVFQGGREVARQAGAMPATQLQQLVAAHA